MMVLVLLVGGGVGWFVRRAKVQRDAVAAIKRVGGGVLYDWHYKNGGDTPNGKPRWPIWLVKLVGVDYFGSVVKVDATSKSTISNSDLVYIERLSRLEALDLNNSSVTDDGLAHLTGLARLQYLNLCTTEVTDSGLVHLKGLTSLQYLYLYHTTVTDAGVEKLQMALPSARIEYTRRDPLRGG